MSISFAASLHSGDQAGARLRAKTITRRRGFITPASTGFRARNLTRRNITSGQRAMAEVLLQEMEGFFRSEKLANGLGQEAAERAGVSGARISQARFIRRYLPEIALLVASGGETLDGAYKKAQAERDACESDTAKLDRLKAEAPDLADLVGEGR